MIDPIYSSYDPGRNQVIEYPVLAGGSSITISKYVSVAFIKKLYQLKLHHKEHVQLVVEKFLKN